MVLLSSFVIQDCLGLILPSTRLSHRLASFERMCGGASRWCCSISSGRDLVLAHRGSATAGLTRMTRTISIIVAEGESVMPSILRRRRLEIERIRPNEAVCNHVPSVPQLTSSTQAELSRQEARTPAQPRQYGCSFRDATAIWPNARSLWRDSTWMSMCQRRR